MFDDDDSGDRPSLGPPPDRPVTIPVAVLWFILANVLTIVFVAVTYSLRPGSETDLVNGVACQAAGYVITVYLILRVHAAGRSVSELLGLRATHPGFYAVGLLLGVALQIPAELLQRAIFHFKPMDPEVLERQAELLRMDSGLSRVMIPVAVIVLGPFVEEVLFRGALFGRLRQQNPEISTVLLVSILFAGAHMNAELFIPMLVIGGVVTLLRSWSGSLVPCLIAHATFNAVPVAGVAFGWFELDASPEPLPLSLSVGGVVVSLVLVAGLLGLSRSAAAHRARQEDLT